MDDTPLSVLLAALFFLILLSAEVTPKTLNGLITEHMEMIPETGTSLLLDNRPVDIVQIKENMVKAVRIYKPLENNTIPATEDAAE